MVTHTKTTIELSDALLEEAKRVAARDGCTLRELVETGLRRIAVDAWLESPTLVLLSEHDRHWPELRDLLRKGRISGPRSTTRGSRRSARPMACATSGPRIATSPASPRSSRETR